MSAIRGYPLWLKFGFAFAVAGFGVAVVLCGYAFYLTSHQGVGDMRLFLALCPPSIASMALDNAGVIGGLIGWMMIAVMNASVYGVVGAACGSVWTFVSRAEK